MYMRQGRMVLCLTGRLTFKARRGIQDVMEKVRAAGCHSLVVDLSALAYIDSSALGLLSITGRQWKAEGRWVVLAEPTPYVREILAPAEISKLIPLYATVEEAVRAPVST